MKIQSGSICFCNENEFSVREIKVKDRLIGRVYTYYANRDISNISKIYFRSIYLLQEEIYIFKSNVSNIKDFPEITENEDERGIVQSSLTPCCKDLSKIGEAIIKSLIL